jgi:hypothetical protein
MAVLAVAGSVMLLGTGCPEDFKKGGTNDRAMRKDTQENFFRRDHPGEADDEEEPNCREDQTAEWKCDPEPCRWVCK